MEEAQWDIKEIKQLKKTQLVRGNLFMLLIFVLLVYFLENGQFFLITWVILASLVIAIMLSLYTLKTAKLIGTKTSKRVQEFERNRFGEARWKRNKIIEVVLFTVLGVGIAVLLFVTDFSSPYRDFPGSQFPFIGAWVGYNLGMVTRMNKLKEQPEIG